MLKSAQIVSSEKQLSDLLATNNSIASLHPSADILFAREFRTQLGIPDYVLLSNSDSLELKRFSNTYSGLKLSGKYSAIISFIHSRGDVNVQEMSEFFYEQKSNLLRVLNNLEDYGIGKEAKIVKEKLKGTTIPLEQSKVKTIIEQINAKIKSDDLDRKAVQKQIDTGTLTISGTKFSLTDDQIKEIQSGIRSFFQKLIQGGR